MKYKIVFVGTGKIKKYQRLAKKYGIENNLHFANQIKDRSVINTLLTQADLLLMPSIAETYGLTIDEAGKCGTPSVVIDKTVFAERITDNENGYVSPIDENAYAQKIFTAMTDKKTLAQTSRKAFETLGKSWDEIALRYLNLYYEILKKSQ